MHADPTSNWKNEKERYWVKDVPFKVRERDIPFKVRERDWKNEKERYWVKDVPCKEREILGERCFFLSK